MKLSKERKGELFIFFEGVIWGLFPVITILSYAKLSPFISFFGSAFFATIFFAVILTVKNKWPEIKNSTAIKDILFATFITGVLFYLLYFSALKFSSAGNVSVVALTEVFFSYLLFNIWKKDFISSYHIIGVVLMVIGALIVLYPNVHNFNKGDILMLLAAFIAPFGNFFMQRARKTVSSESIMFIRSLVSTIFIFLLIFVIKIPFSFVSLKQSIAFFLINGIFMFGLTKILWIEGIHRISVVKANGISSLSPLITLLFAWIFLHNLPTVWQLLSFIPMFFGILLLGKNLKQKEYD